MSKLMEVNNVLQQAGLSGKKPEGSQDENDDDDGQVRQNDDESGLEEGQGEGEGLEDGQGEEDTDGEPVPKLRVTEAADKLGIKARDLYDQLQVPMGDGETLTLGEMKDLASRGKKALAEVAEIRDTSDNASRELMLQRADLTKAAELLAPFLKPEQQEAIAGLQQAHTQREVKLLMGALPAWKNQDTAKKEMGRMHKVVAAYGISASELDVLVQDHRLVRLLRDVAMRAGQENKKPAPKPGGRNTSSILNDAYKRGSAPGASKADKLSAITSLLK